MNKIVLSIVRIGIVRSCLLWVLKRQLVQRRRFLQYLKRVEEVKLQIGCGTNLLDGWFNTGISLKECWYGAYLDAGKPFPFSDSTFDYIFSEHLFEHLTYKQGLNMLKECYRVLKPGGVMRLATPDLRFLLGLYQDPEKLINKAYMVYSVTENGMPPSPV